VGPDEVEGAMTVGLDVARAHAVDLLLEDHAGEQGRHHRRGNLNPHARHFVSFAAPRGGARRLGAARRRRFLSPQLPPGLRHDVQETRVLQLHAFLEAGDLRHLRRLATGLPHAAAGGDHRGVPVVRVHAQLALVVGAPEAEGDKPGVQQARVVRVLDVLLHQLPVARDALAVVA